ncbi:nicotinate-nucleotide--dimethylbenzimidazole phosphoribosyltransferase [Tellurirhabdus bombi]|uniref:nicotinate-nucleotide--dimethylbenzimidazole phosphoribosyltransferase n=1 Tax=Tellurirhabdus bombi TaxID=2907205 RepID=UPI001F4330CD|nr:nicotinate-nucleotide--dimethylbenzimidazole phosphoribosyltransferase [Tellurirhabdus bombi]
MSIAIPETLRRQLQDKINNKTKPLGALGKLEKLALQVGLIQQTLSPKLIQPHLVVFAASHGIARDGVSAYPTEVTHQMVLNFLQGGAAINVFTRQHGMALQLVDAGVDHDFAPSENLINAKINHGTRSFLREPAMTPEECQTCLQKGAEIVQEIAKTGCNVIGFGEMGIGNTSSASALMSQLLGIPVAECVGRGTGLDEAQFAHKVEVLEQALAFHASASADPLTVLQTFGGFEIAMMCGAFLAAAQQRMILLVDGFIASVAFLCAGQLDASVMEFAVFCHQSDEKGHARLLSALSVEPLLQLNMRLGEGTGCAVAYPLLQSAVAFLNEMASFDSAQVSRQS